MYNLWPYGVHGIFYFIPPYVVYGRCIIFPVPSSGQADIHSVPSARQAATSVAHEPMPSSSRQETGMVEPPWPTTDHLMDTSTDLPVPGIVDALNILPGATQERVSRFVLPTLSLHAHVLQKTRAKVWSGDFVDLTTLLPETCLFQPNYALTICPGEEDGNPAFCVAPTSRTVIRSFPQWSKAFQIYMSVFLLKPENVEEAAKMLKYMQTVRNLSERGSNWRGYDESFQALRAMQGWSWDSVNYELWLNAAHQPRLVSQGESPFLDRGVGNQGARTCQAYNRGPCAYNPCRFHHICKLCGGSHPATKCPKSQARKSTIPQRIIRKH